VTPCAENKNKYEVERHNISEVVSRTSQVVKMESQEEVAQKGKDLLPVREPGQDYHKYFNAKDYNKMHYTNLEGHLGAMVECVIRFYHKVFSQGWTVVTYLCLRQYFSYMC